MHWKNSRKTMVTAGLAVFLPLLSCGLPAAVGLEFTTPDMDPPGRRVGGASRATNPFPNTSPGQNDGALFESSDPNAPGRRVGGATRGGTSVRCLADGQLPEKEHLSALVPATTLGLTAQGYPEFFWYMPKTSAPEVEFVLTDADNKEVIYETSLKTNGQAGIVSISLPENATLPPLEANKDYHWSVFLVCDRGDRGADVFVDGWLRRVEPSATLAQRLRKETPLGRAALYAQEGLWHETVSYLVKLRQSNPDNSELIDEWQELLKSVGLEDVANEPLLGGN